jgi:hypothetical protein
VLNKVPSYLTSMSFVILIGKVGFGYLSHWTAVRHGQGRAGKLPEPASKVLPGIDN